MTDFALTLNTLSWVFYNRIFQVLTEYGVIYLPLAIYVYKNWYAQLTHDANTTIVQVSIKGMLVDVVVFLFVYYLALLPTMSLQKVRNTYNITTTPQSTTIQNNLNNLQSNLDLSELDSTGRPNTALKIPIIWASIDIFTNQFNKAVIQNIPSNVGDIRTKMASAIAHIDIASPSISKQYSQFSDTCWLRSLGKFDDMVDNGDISTGLFSGINKIDYNWVGGRYLVNTKGFYKPCAETDTTCYKEVPTPKGFYIANNGITTSCHDAWLILKPKLQEVFNIPVGDQDYALRVYINANQQKATANSNTDSSGGGVSSLFNNPIDTIISAIKNIISVIGANIVLFFTEIATTVIVAFLPMGQAIALSFFVILLPIAMLVSALRVDILVQFLMFYFTISFLTVIWAIVKFIDNNLLYLVYGADDSDISQIAVSAVTVFSLTGTLMAIATLFMYYFATSKWFQLMTMAGSQAGKEAGTSFGATKDTASKVGSQAESVGTKAGSSFKK